eukprot:CAMPEP_0119404462 /NCGR_PEP_ID=MMETSP1334-20130426/143908_1 /TAXON_ID=127549 /ORGANISM="Calcidiscus leptoporus, Strain RCC1130" /LENGTH=84 /DNA_ID=CAMNT_0007428429 /DNA_START=170 /DNA_END=424 /DNA_ORIENTATION=-
MRSHVCSPLPKLSGEGASHMSAHNRTQPFFHVLHAPPLAARMLRSRQRVASFTRHIERRLASHASRPRDPQVALGLLYYRSIRV